MAATKALRNLYKKLVGHDAPLSANTSSEIINKIAEDYSGGGDEAASGVFVMRTTDYDSDEGLWETVDKTFAEVLEAISKNQFPVIYVADGNLVDYVWYYCGNTYASITFFAISSDLTPTISRLSMDADGHFTRI